MAVYVDPLGNFGWRLRGRTTPNCHLFTDERSLRNLHRVARRIGMKRDWFQDSDRAPHYDLTPARRQAAIAAGAIEVDRREAVRIWRRRRDMLAQYEEVQLDAFPDAPVPQQPACEHAHEPEPEQCGKSVYAACQHDRQMELSL